MRVTTRKAAIASVGALALALTACGGGGDDGDGGSGGDGANGGGTFSTYIGEPENPLVPGNTNETNGGQVVDAIWTGLVEYNTETSQPEFTGVAESIESEDNVTWTITLKDGWTFHDGSPVTAQDYVDTWNYTANSQNAQGNSYFFSNVEGYEDLQAEEGEEPAATELSGLEVVDDLTFEVTLNEPYTAYPTTLGYNAFYPQPPSFFEDPEAAGEQPIGNGPFRAEEPLEPGVGINLTRYDDFAGEQPAQAAGVEFRIYTEMNTAYTDVQAGALDVINEIPPDAITSAPDEFGDRHGSSEQGDMTYLMFPTYDERFSDPDVRKAFSMAIDREAITSAVYDDTRTPATSFVPPVIPGYREDACGPCNLDAEQANQLLDDAGFDRSEPVELWFNAGAGHEEWMQAVGNQLRDNLGIEYQLRGDLQFAEYLPLGDDQGFTGPFRLGWVMDYPVMDNFIDAVFGTAAQPPNGSNMTFYSNEEFDSLIQQGNAGETEDDAIASYQQAEDILVDEMPAAPLWFRDRQYVHSERVDNVTVNAYGRVEVADVTVTE